ncbi:chloride channel [Sporodiniella umbellata]|nr:chloride channel [Sporodiniella umbellata]
MSALIAIVTDWLSDIKLGYCQNAWWLNQKFCCWEIENSDGGCADWKDWGESMGFGPDIYVIKWLFYVLWAVSRYTLSVASNLSLGKEGPSVHMACCVGNVIARCFKKFIRSKAEMREMLTASSAAGVAVAFGSPIGGVLFALEEMSNIFPNKTMWKSFFCAMIATIVLQAMNPFRTGKLVMFQVSYDRDWHFFEYIFVIVIGLFGGMYGTLVIKYNLMVAKFRKTILKDFPITEAGVLAFFTALIAYPNVFLRIDMTEIMGILFRECEGVGSENYYGLCDSQETGRMVVLLLVATLLRCFGTIVTYGARVPCGIFVPSMAIGATFGRIVGLLVKLWQENNPDFFLFSSCRPDMPCITPGTYAFLGAAAALGGVMNITVSVVVIMFELTGQITYILPTMIALMVTRAVNDWFEAGGIADRYIRLNGYPILDGDDRAFGVAVSCVMQTDMTVLTAANMTFRDIENILETTDFQANNNAHEMTICRFTLDTSDEPEILTNIGEDERDLLGSSEVIDFGPYMDQAPITVHPKLYLETVMDIFKQLGPRVVLLELKGKLKGLITVKDVLKYIARTENTESSVLNQSPDRDCNNFFGPISSWLNKQRLYKHRHREQSYTQIENRSSIDLESHELSRQ